MIYLTVIYNFQYFLSRISIFESRIIDNRFYYLFLFIKFIYFNNYYLFYSRIDKFTIYLYFIYF